MIKEKKCKVCGKKLRVLSRNKVYCSDLCRQEGNRMWHRNYQKKHRENK